MVGVDVVVVVVVAVVVVVVVVVAIVVIAVIVVVDNDTALCLVVNFVAMITIRMVCLVGTQEAVTVAI